MVHRRLAMTDTSPPGANPLLADAPLPPFEAIRPEHVVPALSRLLTEQRARVAQLESQSEPTFATLVEPLEELRHRLGRVWSPVGHLNAVMNSDALRTAYNECLPLLSEFQTDLAQSEPLYRAYFRIGELEGGTLDPVQRQVVEHALKDFRLAGVALEPARKARFKAIMMELSRLSAKFEENVLDAVGVWRHHVSDRGQLSGINAGVLEQAERRAREAKLSG